MARLRQIGLGNCPGDPECPGYVAPDSAEYNQSVQDELAALYDQYRALLDSSAPAAPAAQTLEEWLRAHQKAVLTVCAGLVGLAMFSELGARR